MAEDLSIKVKVDPDVSDVQGKLNNKSGKISLPVKVNLENETEIQAKLKGILKKKLVMDVQINPNTADLQTRLNQISKNLKLNLKLFDDSETTKALESMSEKLKSAMAAMQQSAENSVGKGFNVSVKSITALNNAIGQLQSNIAKVGGQEARAKLESQFADLKKSYNDFLGKGTTSIVDFSSMQQTLARIKDECNSVIQTEQKLVDVQERVGNAAKNAGDKAAEALQRQASAANSLYENLLRNKSGVPEGYGNLIDPSVYAKMLSSFDAASAAKNSFDANKTEASLATYKKSLSELASAVGAFNKELSNAKSKSGDALQGLSGNIDFLTGRLNSLKQAYKSSGIDSAEIQATISQLEKALQRLYAIKNSVAVGDVNYDSFVQLFNDMRDASTKAGIPINSMSDLMKALNINTKNAMDTIRSFNKELQDTGKNESLVKRLNNLQYTLTRYVDSNKKIKSNDNLFGSYKSIKSKIEAALKSQDTSNMEAVLNSQSAAVADLKRNVQSLGLEGKTLAQVFRDLFGQHFSTMIAMGALHLIQNSLRQMYQNVLDIDTAMTELRKVTDETAASYTSFLERSSSTAKELGADVSDLINTTADWARLGYGIQDAEQLARVSTLYKNVGDGIETASEASEYLISTLKGFKLDASDAQRVLDVINAVSNTQPVSAKDLGEIMKRSSAALSAANNTVEETIALGTAMNSVLQDAAKTGTALKTVSMYLRATDTELKEAGESTEGMAESTSKLRAELLALTHGKVDIQLDENTYKSTYQILKEMSKAWDSMTDKEHAAALELMGGKRNSNAVEAVIKQFKIAEDSLSKAQNSAGSAMQENEKYLASIQGKLTKFQATFEVLSNNFLNSELVKGVVDLGTGILNVTDGFIKLGGAIPAVTTALSALISLGNVDTSGNRVKMFSYAGEIAA